MKPQKFYLLLTNEVKISGASWNFQPGYTLFTKYHEAADKAYELVQESVLRGKPQIWYVAETVTAFGPVMPEVSEIKLTETKL